MLRHLVTRVERPLKTARRDGEEGDVADEGDMLPSGLDDEEDEELHAELIDESESEAAPAAID